MVLGQHLQRPQLVGIFYLYDAIPVLHDLRDRRTLRPRPEVGREDGHPVGRASGREVGSSGGTEVVSLPRIQPLSGEGVAGIALHDPQDVRGLTKGDCGEFAQNIVRGLLQVAEALLHPPADQVDDRRALAHAIPAGCERLPRSLSRCDPGGGGGSGDIETG